MLTAWFQRRAIRKLDEHLYVLKDQRDSAIAGIEHYEAKRKRLVAKLFAAERPRKLIGAQS